MEKINAETENPFVILEKTESFSFFALPGIPVGKKRDNQRFPCSNRFLFS